MKAKKFPKKGPLAMDRHVLNMWYLAMNSEDFNRLNRSDYEHGNSQLRTETGSSPVGVLCDLYGRTWGEDRWVKTNNGWEWDGIWLGKCPDDVIKWAFDLGNLGLSASRTQSTVKELREILFAFDCWADTQDKFPGYNHLVRVFG
jgi:hypothetical protein